MIRFHVKTINSFHVLPGDIILDNTDIFNPKYRLVISSEDVPNTTDRKIVTAKRTYVLKRSDKVTILTP